MGYSNEAKIRHYLGIDYGTAKVGLAIADSETKIAFVLATLDNNAQFLEKLFRIIAEKEIDAAIIGIPSHINKSEVVYAAEKIGEMIEKKAKVSVEYQNEMFTTKMAQRNLIERGVKGVKKYDDQEAARIILQEWLDNR